MLPNLIYQKILAVVTEGEVRTRVVLGSIHEKLDTLLGAMGLAPTAVAPPEPTPQPPAVNPATDWIKSLEEDDDPPLTAPGKTTRS
jgi:hypothetical protein